MPLVAGTTLGPYEILAPLGAGGMGEVYRARDTRLKRDIAIKVLPDDVASSPERLARFEREATTVAGLNHPNIVVLHSIEEALGTRFLTMELVEGRDLSSLVTPGGLPLTQVLELAIPLAEALVAAHEKGVVHRDLKPANVMVTPEGRVKVLDFGLAKLTPNKADLERSEGATLTVLSTTGEVVGTAPYMAPEQILGETVDARTDLFSFGVMLYELATGLRPFAGRAFWEVSAAIMHQRPPSLTSVRSDMPADLERIVGRCLEKRPRERFQTALDVANELRELRRMLEPGAPLARPMGRRLHWMWAGGALVGVAVLAALALGIGEPRRRLFRTPGAPHVRSLAVLPLESLTQDPARGYFAEGMTEALIAELSKISALRVTSRTSVMKYKGSMKTAPEVSRELGVDALIEGTVQREGDQVRITLQLIHGSTDSHLWVQTYDRKLNGILALYSDIAQAVAEQIQIKLTPQEKSRLAATRVVNPRAYELYVFGRHQLNQRTIASYRVARERFEQALQLDSTYAPAHAALADAYMLLGEQGGGGLRSLDARSLAITEIRKAMALDANLPEAHVSLGWWKLHYEWNWAESEQAFRRAIELNPSLAAAHQIYGRTLGFACRFGEALAELQRARELDPLSATIRAYLGQVYLFARQYDNADEQLQRALEIDPNHALTHHNLGELRMAQGRFDDAVGELERSVEISGQEVTSHYLAMLACAYAKAKRSTDAHRILKELEARQKRGLVSEFDMASLYNSFGEHQRAIEWLERGYKQRDPWLVEMNAWPWFDAQREDPRFQELLRRVGHRPRSDAGRRET